MRRKKEIITNMLAEIIFNMFAKIAELFAWVFPNPMGQNPLLLPYGLDNIFQTGITGYKILAQSFPPFTYVMNAFVILLVFKIIMRFMKMIPIIGRAID